MSEKGLSKADELVRGHSEFLKSLRELENRALTVFVPAVENLQSALTRVQDYLVKHVHHEEELGYMEAVLAHDPHRDRVVKHLEEEHRQLVTTLYHLIEKVTTVAHIDQDISLWISRMNGHQANEMRIVQETLNRDSSAED
jgi:hypothetical protein